MTTDIRVLLGGRIRALRRSRLISQADLADSIRMSRSFLSALERGEKSASVETLERLARGLGVPVVEFLLVPVPSARPSGAEALGRLVTGLAARASEEDVERFARMARAYFEKGGRGEPSQLERVARAYFAASRPRRRRGS